MSEENKIAAKKFRSKANLAKFTPLAAQKYKSSTKIKTKKNNENQN
jgi:hypothetical protein